MGTNDPKSYEDLIRTAEKRAVDAGDPDKVNFLSFLKNGGIIMPSTEDDDEDGKPGEPIKLFLNSAVVKRMIAKTTACDSIQTEATAQHEANLKSSRAELFSQLRQETLKAHADWAAAQDPDEHAGLGDEYEEGVPEPVIRTNEEVMAEVEIRIPTTPARIPDRVQALVNEINELTQTAYGSRLEVHLSGVQPEVVRDYQMEIEVETRRPDQKRLSEVDLDAYRNTRDADELLAHAIIEVFNPATNEREDFREKRMTASTAHSLITMLPASEVTKLLVAAQTLSYAAVLLDLKTDAGFLGGPVEPEVPRPMGTGDQDGEGVGR